MLKRQQTNTENGAKLYLVPTPIGNFSDMTIRGIETLKMVDYIYCEDTRVTKRLLAHYEIKTALISYHNHNENELTTKLIDRIKNGNNIAIVSDAGSPLISDPGYLAVREAISNGICVVSLPGASASITALIGSGITSNRFLFIGFLNSNYNKRKKELEVLKNVKDTLILYESPHRIKETLELLNNIIPNRYVVLARELTKKYEEYFRGTSSEILEFVEQIKGEIVLIIEGIKEQELNSDLLSESIKKHCEHYLNIGYNIKEAMKMVAKDRGVSKSYIYQELKKK